MLPKLARAQHPKKVAAGPLFCGITSAITDAIRLAGYGTVPCPSGPYSPNCRRACVCDLVNQSPVRPDGGTRQAGEGWQEGLEGFCLAFDAFLGVFLAVQLIRHPRLSGP